MSKKETVHGTPWSRRRVAHVSELEADGNYRRWKIMGSRHSFDHVHSAQVCRLALALFDELKNVHGLGPRDRVLLMAAALLHDIGAHRRKATPVGARLGHEHPHHHKRSQRIILDEGVPGLDDEETRVVACVARYHTHALPHRSHNHFRDLCKHERRRVCRLAAMLRIADSLDRRHKAMVKDLRCHLSEDGGELTIWVFCKKHRFDWRPKHRTDLFEKEFGVTVRIQILFGTAVG